MEYEGEGGIQDIRNRIYKRRGQVTLNAQGTATIAFDPPIILERQPFILLEAATATNTDLAIANRVPGTFTTNASGAYTGVTIRGARVVGKLPTLTAVSGILTSVITGVNAIVSALSGFTLVRTDQATGVAVDWMAF